MVSLLNLKVYTTCGESNSSLRRRSAILPFVLWQVSRKQLCNCTDSDQHDGLAGPSSASKKRS